MRFCLLIQTTERVTDDNFLRLGRALAAMGHDVNCVFIDSLRLAAGDLMGHGFLMSDAVAVDDPFPATSPIRLDAHDIVWVLGLGERASFLDKIQLLFTLRSTRIINSLDALMHLKSKYFLTGLKDVIQHPETHAATNPQELLDIIKREGGQWIAKPPAGSLGRDVFLLGPDDQNALAILQHLCGPDANQYTLLQRYIPEIAGKGEKRVLLAAGQVVGQYRRLPGSDHRTNVAQGAAIEPCDLSDEERTCCEAIAAYVLNMDAVYVGLDLVYPWIIELNVVNPGGLATLEALNGEDLSGKTASLIEAFLAQNLP